MQVHVGRIGKPHGIRGEVTVEVLTDAPQDRFAAGAVFATEPTGRGPLTVATARWNKEILLLGFEEVLDRNQAEALRGTRLVFDTDSELETDDDAWYEHELIGLAARIGSEEVGKVVALTPMPAQDLLVIKTAAGEEVLVPFVTEIVPEVDIEAGFIRLTPPGGLFEVNRDSEAEQREGTE
ncbi:ribosome maturation factor RimM [Arthrobacter russicus]|uniref:Ribosome maturation factor RimM n=1 Tax=Arthrobacter russicus TaxID=172040 RepID=A0ABU1J7W3_9MICC|nr:ribosome maturation factor RimM [Arthrobacter russicus]MDR6268225.1 16S rRNA processing protein RimM [Arthrobacter russicus]